MGRIMREGRENEDERLVLFSFSLFIDVVSL